jgi:hypothetical protein
VSRPRPLLAVAMLALNDHVLKGAGVLPGWLTGKLSDVAGLYFFPLLLLSLVEGSRALFAARPLPASSRRRLALGLAVATAGAFVAVKLDPSANDLYAALLGPTAMDTTDLVALPAALLGLREVGRGHVAGDHESPEKSAKVPASVPAAVLPRWAQALVVVLAALASLATSAPRMTRNFPAWGVTSETSATMACASVEAWVSKSGKEGFGLTLKVQNTTERPCPVELVEARFAVDALQIPASPLPGPLPLGPYQVDYVYLPFVFDNEALWNAGERAGALALGFRVEGRALPPWELRLTHAIDGFHTDRVRQR